MSNFTMNNNDRNMNATENINNGDFDPTLDADWEALEGILFENDTVGEDENCIRINPISSNYSVSQKIVSSTANETSVSLPMQQNPYPQNNYYSVPNSYPPNYQSQMTGNQFGYYTNTGPDLNQVNYVGSAGNSKKSVDFEEFLRSPAARELFEGSPQYSFNSVGQEDGVKAPTRKLKRDEAFGVSPSSSSAAIDDDEGAEGIKAMRGGSLGRVIASSVAVASFVDQDRNARLFGGDGRAVDPALLTNISTSNNNSSFATNSNSTSSMTKDEEKKQLMSQFFQKLNRCDISGLVKIIRHCDVGCVLSTPDVLEPITGRSDIMMLISLFIEAYPDGIWTPSTIVVTGDTATCNYRFMGTRVFDHPINTLYRQIKTHIGSIIAASSEHHQIDFFSDNNRDTLLLVNEVAEGAVPTDSHHTNANNNSSASAVWEWQGQEQNAYKQYRDQLQQIAASGIDAISSSSSPRDTMVAGEEDSSLHPSNKIMFRRRSRTLREVKEIETAILEEGPTMYRRKLEFIFNEENEIIQIVFTNLL